MLSIVFPKLPFGAPKRCSEIRKELERMAEKYVKELEKKSETKENYVSILTEKPHVSGIYKDQPFSMEEIIQSLLSLIFASHINLEVTLIWNFIFLLTSPSSSDSGDDPSFVDRLVDQINELEKSQKDPESSSLLSHSLKGIFFLHFFFFLFFFHFFNFKKKR